MRGHEGGGMSYLVLNDPNTTRLLTCQLLIAARVQGQRGCLVEYVSPVCRTRRSFSRLRFDRIAIESVDPTWALNESINPC